MAPWLFALAVALLAISPTAPVSASPAPAPAPSSRLDISAVDSSPEVSNECPDFGLLAFEALWEPAPISSEPARATATVTKVAAALGLETAAVRTSLEEFDALTLASAAGDSDAAALAAAWTATPIANVSLVNATAVAKIGDEDAGAFAVLECLKASVLDGTGKSQISTFLGLIAASPFRKYLWLPSAAFFIPTNAAIDSTLATLGNAAVATEVDEAFYAQVDAPRASFAVGLHVVPDVSDTGSLDADHRVLTAGYDQGWLAYRTTGDSASIDRVWTVNSTVDDHEHAASILTRIGGCTSWNTASLYVIDAVLACNGTGDACPFAADVGGVEYKPAANARKWTL